MVIDFTFSMKVFSSLFAIMNPIANIPVFISLTEGLSDGKKRAVAATTFIGVTIGCVISVTLGEAILNVFGVSIDDFRLAGRVAPYLGRFLSARVTAITKRLMGMILAAIAVEMMAASLTAIFKGLLHQALARRVASRTPQREGEIPGITLQCCLKIFGPVQRTSRQLRPSRSPESGRGAAADRR